MTDEGFLHGTYQPGAIYHMLAGWPIEYEGAVREGPPDTITIPDELGNGERRILTAEVLIKCPMCSDRSPELALVLEDGLRLSECLACDPPRFLWYRVVVAIGGSAHFSCNRVPHRSARQTRSEGGRRMKHRISAPRCIPSSCPRPG